MTAHARRVKGIRCPICHGQTKVVKTRERKYGVYRRHKCLRNPRHRFSTQERMPEPRAA